MMVFNINVFVGALFVHFVADFILQSNTMATKKSSSLLWLFAHVLTYSIALTYGLLLVNFRFSEALTIGVVNFIAHLIIDAITSRWTTYFWQREKYRLFFWVVGFDQFLHAACLLYSITFFTFGVLIR